MKLVVTIDTEEDNWGNFDLTDYSVHNIELIPELQNLLTEFGVKPTYLINYPVASNSKAVSILRGLLGQGVCEIGMQCHPWNTPPFEEEHSKRNTMLCNLPSSLQFRKIKVLHEMIVNNFGTVPIAFRAGRWGYSKDVALALDQLGYKIDTSITPFTDWSGSSGPDFSMLSLSPYYFNPKDILKADRNGSMLEIPITIGFTQANFELADFLFTFLKKQPFNQLRLIGLLDKLRLLNKVWLSPEQSSSRDMISLTKRLIQKEVPLANLFFHSPTLYPGLTPYVRTQDDKQEFIGRIKRFLRFVKRESIEPILLSDTLKQGLTC